MKKRTGSALLSFGVLFALLWAGASQASTYSVICDITANLYYNGVEDTLTMSPSGILYGTQSGDSGGKVFALHPPAAGKTIWTESNVFLFEDSGPNNPEGGVALAPGALLGSTTNGGTGFGIVFKLENPTDPALTTVHAFAGNQVYPPDGSGSLSGLTAGPNGEFFGATYEGEDYLQTPATVFETTASASSPRYHVIHRFTGKSDGRSPLHGRLWIDAQGSLYGTTSVGGAYGFGTVFMMQFSGGAWKEQVIHSFQHTGDLNLPVANVVLDSQGNVYGCAQGGTHQQGGIFRLAPPAQPGGAWTETVLYNFGDAPMDPIASLGTVDEGCGIAIDPATGILYGTSYGGGTAGYGTIYSLTPPAAGQTAWTETIIHSFTDGPYDGAIDGEYPVAPPLKVGATYYGGTLSGEIYSFVP